MDKEMHKNADNQIRYYPPSNIVNRMNPMGVWKPQNTQREVHVPGKQSNAVYF